MKLMASVLHVRTFGNGKTAAVRWGAAVLVAGSLLTTAQQVGAETAERVRSPQHFFFGFGASKPGDLEAMKVRGSNAVMRVQSCLAARGFEASSLLGFSGASVSTNRAPAALTRAALTKAFADLRGRLGTNDTIVLYSHTHGVQGRFGREGGLVLDDPAPSAVLTWTEYAEQLFALPAKTVVVLVMACHSGGLTDSLKTDPKACSLLQERREQGRAFLVITSQNAKALSNPRRIDGEVINPFTYAVQRAFEGEADGYERGRAAKEPDGRLTLAELTAYAVDEAKRHTRLGDTGNDADPQSAGAFAPETVLESFSAARPVPIRQALTQPPAE